MDTEESTLIKIIVIGDENLPSILEFSISENISCNKIIELDGLNIELVYLQTHIETSENERTTLNKSDLMDAIAVIFFVDQ